MKDIFETNGLKGVRYLKEGQLVTQDIAKNLIETAQVADFLTSENHNEPYTTFRSNLASTVMRLNATTAMAILPPVLEEFKRGEHREQTLFAGQSFPLDTENDFSYPQWVVTGKDERNSVIRLLSGGRGIIDHGYPGYVFEVAGQKLGQVRNPPKNMDNEIGESYFCAVQDNGCSALINMIERVDIVNGVEKEAWDNGYHYIKKGQSKVFGSKTVECLSEDIVASEGCDSTFRKAKYRITENGVSKEIDYIGFRKFDDNELDIKLFTRLKNGNVQEQQDAALQIAAHNKLLKAKSELVIKAIDYLDEQHALDGRVMTNCNQGQNRSNFMNTAIAYRKAIHNQIDAIVQAYPGDLARQNQEIAKLQTFLQTEVAHGTSPGYTNAHVLAEGLRAQIELNARISSKQRDQVLAFATHQTGHIIEHYVAKVRAQGLEETKAEDKSAEFAQHAGPLRAASPVRAASPTQDGGRAAGAASPISPRVTPVNEAVNLMLIALRDGNPTKEDLLGIVNLMPPEEQEGIRVLVEHSPPESLISNLERTARQSPSSPQTRSPSPSDTKSVANEEAGMERAIIQHLYNRFNSSRYLNSGVEDRERRGGYLQTLINQTELSEQRKGELILQLGAMETGQEVMQVFGQLGAVQRERAPFVATFRPVTPESKDQEGVSDGYRLLIKSMRDQATLLAAYSITEEQFEKALQDLLKSHSALITPEEKKDLESLLKHQKSNELRKIMHNKLDEIKSLAAMHRAVRDFRDGTEGHGYAAGFGPSPSPSSGRSNGSGGCSIQ